MKYTIPKCRKIRPDVIYSSLEIQKLINMIMLDGKKDVATKIVYSAIDGIKDKILAKHATVAAGISHIVNQVSPQLGISRRKVGGSVYSVPVKLTPQKSMSRGLKNIADRVKTKKDARSNIATKVLMDEFLDILEGKGYCINQKITMHKNAEANKAYAHFQ